MDVVLLGPPGAGKGTQARFIIESNSLMIHLSTGDVLRSEINSKTQLGLSIQDQIDSGELVSDDLISKIVESWVRKQSKKHILFDGFPRTSHQVDLLMDFMVRMGREFVVIELRVLSDELIDRLNRRCVCSQCGYIDQTCKAVSSQHVWSCSSCGSRDMLLRSDDRDEIVVRRIETYDREIESIRERLAHHRILYHIIDGAQPVQIVRSAIASVLKF